MKAEYWIRKLSLEEHPEGGYFRQAYKSNKSFALQGYEGLRSAATAIYYLLKRGQFSAFHRMKSDEIWHFYAGSPMELCIIDSKGDIETVIMGRKLHRGQILQAHVQAGRWFAASVAGRGRYSLVGCTVTPGFEYQDWEMGVREKLLKEYPKCRKAIMKYTR